MILRFINYVIEKETSEESFWYLVGALGDGTLYFDNGRYVVEYGQKSIEWLKISVGARLIKFGLKPLIVRHRGNYWKLKVYSKDLYERVKNGKGVVPESNYFLSYCRGLFDAEGSIIRQDKYRVCMRISQKNKELLASVRENLLKVGVKTTNLFLNDKNGVYVIQIPYYSIKLFLDRIGTNHPDKFEKLMSLGFLKLPDIY